ncbi:hypothetical protein, partial [uncultured Bacteroides sp.]|uniref:hypothetical protein n=1 Tax=uncultured Bacteroides sp. TaxID=162156 RepID=UPI00280BB0F9
SAFSMFSPSFTGTTIMFFKLSMLLLNYFAVNLGAKLRILSLFTKHSSIFYSKIKDKDVTKTSFLTDLLFLSDRFIFFI